MSSKHESHWLEREDIGDVTIVRLTTPKFLDDEVVRTVFDPICSLASSMGRNRLVLNLAAVEFLPSMGLGKLVLLNRTALSANGRLALCHLCPRLQENLETTRLVPLFNIYATEQEALQSFS